MINSFWDKFYKNKGNNFFWPWTDLVKLVNRHLNKKKRISVLEIGVGSGANVPFYLSRKFNVYGVDRSKQAIKIFKKKDIPNLKNFFQRTLLTKNLNQKISI